MLVTVTGQSAHKWTSRHKGSLMYMAGVVCFGASTLTKNDRCDDVAGAVCRALGKLCAFSGIDFDPMSVETAKEMFGKDQVDTNKIMDMTATSYGYNWKIQSVSIDIISNGLKVGPYKKEVEDRIKRVLQTPNVAISAMTGDGMFDKGMFVTATITADIQVN